MDLLIFNPPRYKNGKHHNFNNALLWLGSFLHQRGVEVRIVPLHDENFEAMVRQELTTHRPRYVAVSCKWWDTLYSATHIATIVKKLDPTVVTIAGGQSATFFAEELVTATDFDIVVRGDAEEPLYRIVTGQEPLNCVRSIDGAIHKARQSYVQTEAHLRDHFLVENIADLVAYPDLVDGYVWTGKGCQESCVYCAANAWNNRQSFGRTNCIFRPLELVIQDIEILSRFPGVSRIIFDFDLVRGKGQEEYYLQLFDAIKDRKLNTYFFSWSPPGRRLTEALAGSFHFVELCIDAQCPSERLRKFLGDRRYIKPFYPNQTLRESIGYTRDLDNVTVDISTVMGLPFETDADVQEITTFADDLYDEFENVRYPYVSPMNVEPGSLLMRSPQRYDMVVFRDSFSDFMKYTQRSFEENVNCYQPETYGEGVFHPLGACPTADFERGDVFRVYEAWRGVQAHIDRRSREKMFWRLRKYKQYGLHNTGVVGGVDRRSRGESGVR